MSYLSGENYIEGPCSFKSRAASTKPWHVGLPSTQTTQDFADFAIAATAFRPVAVATFSCLPEKLLTLPLPSVSMRSCRTSFDRAWQKGLLSGSRSTTYYSCDVSKCTQPKPDGNSLLQFHSISCNYCKSKIESPSQHPLHSEYLVSNLKRIWLCPKIVDHVHSNIFEYSNNMSILNTTQNYGGYPPPFSFAQDPPSCCSPSIP